MRNRLERFSLKLIARAHLISTECPLMRVVVRSPNSSEAMSAFHGALAVLANAASAIGSKVGEGIPISSFGKSS